jgi:hypothetical protein
MAAIDLSQHQMWDRMRERHVGSHGFALEGSTVSVSAIFRLRRNPPMAGLGLSFPLYQRGGSFAAGR